MTKKHLLAEKVVAEQFKNYQTARFAREIIGVSSRQLQRVIRTRGLLVNGKVAHSKRKLKPNDLVQLYLPVPEQVKIPFGSADNLVILYQDDWLLAADKPAGLPTYSLNSPNGLANQVATYFANQNLVITPRPLHRLDTPTSGLVLFAKDAQTQTLLTNLWQRGQVRRFYWGLCQGEIKEPLELTMPIGGRKARTKITPYQSHDIYTEIIAELITGRTHQIRRHLQEIGHPLLGDGRYGGGNKKETTRLALHGLKLWFPHPHKGGEQVKITSPIPYHAFPFIGRQPL